MRKREGKIINCFVCYKEVYIPKNLFNKRRFCSHKCYSRWKKGNPVFKTWLGKIRPNFTAENNPMSRPEVRKKLSDARKGMKFTKRHRRNISLAKKGKCLGNKHWNWKGGVSSANKYKTIRFSPGFYIYKHRLIAEKILGRKLMRGEVVHHVDLNPQNNSPENLKVMLVADHVGLHKNIHHGNGK